MKKLLLCAMSIALVACSSTPPQQSSVPMDMQTVEAYQQRVASAKNNQAAAKKQGDDWILNASDNKPKVVVVNQPRVYPSVHYGYGWGRHHGHRHHSGVGVRLGHWY